MLANTTRNFFILIVAIYSFYKLLNLNSLTKKKSIFLVISSLIISFTSSLLFLSNLSLNRLYILLLFFVLVKLFTKLRFSIVYITTLFSFALSIITFNLSGIIVGLILLPFQYGNYTLPWFLILIIVGIIQLLLLYYCFHIPRLKKGMAFLYNVPSNTIGSAFCLFAIMSVIIFGHSKTFDEKFTIYIYTTIFILGFLLIYWWNYHITQTYRKFLRKNELDTLNRLIEKQNQEILYYKGETDYLAEMIHRDNKIIPAITRTILYSYENHVPLDLSEWETASPLIEKLKQLYNEREDALETHEKKALDLPSTNFATVNATLAYMKSDAQIIGVPFHVVLFDNLESTIPAKITEDDFNHMLSDLLSNALNACKNISGTSIQVYLGKMDEISTIKICNTGTVFDMETLNCLGFTRHTTHPDTGGSGIGLMSIWRIKEKYRATLLIDETIDTNTASGYTCMNILFNGKNHYMLQSNRHKELAESITRPDIIILAKE